MCLNFVKDFKKGVQINFNHNLSEWQKTVGIENVTMSMALNTHQSIEQSSTAKIPKKTCRKY